MADIIKKINKFLTESTGRWPSIIDFSFVEGSTTYGSDTEEFEALEKLEDTGEFEDYARDMLHRGTIVEYDSVDGVYVVKSDETGE